MKEGLIKIDGHQVFAVMLMVDLFVMRAVLALAQMLHAEVELRRLPHLAFGLDHHSFLSHSMETPNTARVQALSPDFHVQVFPALKGTETQLNNSEEGWAICPPSPTIEYGHCHQDFDSVATREAELKNRDKRLPFLQRLWILQHRVLANFSWLLLYACANFVGFVLRFSCYPQDSAAWWWPAIAKGSAECIMINMVLAILFICYHTISKVRSLLGNCTSDRVFAAARPPVDKHVAFHQVAGMVILLASVVHSLAWVCIIVAIRTCSVANWERSAYWHHQFLRESSIADLVLELPVWTGILMLLCAVIAFPFCLPCARQRSYRVFLAIHMVFLPLTVMLLFHGAACWMGALQFPYWLILPTIVYAREWQQRHRIQSLETRIVRYEFENDTVVLTLMKPVSFETRLQPGMAPAISRLEWHPISISSAPHDHLLRLHIQQVGRWTTTLSSLLRSERSSLKVRLNGPISSSTTHFSRYQVVVFIAGGIGVTPFLSALRHILHSWRQELHRASKLSPIREVYLIWTTRKVHHPKWVLEILAEFQDVLANPLFQCSLVIHLHVTGGEGFEQWSDRSRVHQLIPLPNQSAAVVFEQVTWHNERPDWRTIFSALGRKYRCHSTNRLGVFICANQSLAKLVKDEVAVFNAVARRTTGSRLDVFAESF